MKTTQLHGELIPTGMQYIASYYVLNTIIYNSCEMHDCMCKQLASKKIKPHVDAGMHIQCKQLQSSILTSMHALCPYSSQYIEKYLYWCMQFDIFWFDGPIELQTHSHINFGKSSRSLLLQLQLTQVNLDYNVANILHGLCTLLTKAIIDSHTETAG